jgi:FkbM family methyltransferase
MSDIARYETRHGPMLAFRSDRYITRSFELYGEFSGLEWKLFEQLVHPGMTVVEAGANIGAHTVPLARRCAPGTLHAFEPLQRVFQLLCANLALNDITNVAAYPEGCAGTAGYATAPPLDYGVPFNFGSVSLSPEGAPGLRTRVTPIDGLDLPACHFIKIDVEGYEPQVLRGAEATVRRHRPLLYVENDRKEHQQEVIDVIDSFGYRMYWHAPRLFNAGNFRGNPDNVFGETVSTNLLCIPAESEDSVGGAPPVDRRNWISPIQS